MSKQIKVSLIGNPNTGKTSVFNLLTGLNQQVGNYPGITVEKKIAQFKIANNVNVTLEDYPGAYSIISQSMDEDIVSNNIYKWIRKPEHRPDSIIYVIDINNLRRNLYFCSQILELNILRLSFSRPILPVLRISLYSIFNSLFVRLFK